ncbi:LysR substrate-binding domain-containing protein [Bordetella genomosp. 13]|uniref:LysR substrate-binding domain-containing protein n=1 Tax=Bordetella genomosp. 13 TaxID=463040 RepID=UPI0011A8B4BF|nr:LysR substrate-binding domain-containing protein [Bordetella genomosp. 13]
MDSRYLQTFLDTVRLGSIAAASRHLGLTPASVAQRLKALEQDVGSALLVRAGRTVRPSVAGQRIVEHATAVLREVRDLRSAASATELPAGPLRLGATPTTLDGLLPDALQAWAARHPDIEVYIDPASSPTLYERVLGGQLDAAIMVHPLFDIPKTCTWTRLRVEPMILLAPAGIEVSDPLQALRTQPYIRYDRKVTIGRLAEQYLQAMGIAPTVRFELDGIDSIALLVARGLGVSLVPDWISPFPIDGLVRRHALPGPSISREVGAIWLRADHRSPLAAAFMDVVVRSLAGGPPRE